MLKKSERLSKTETGWLLRKGDKLNNDLFSIKFRLNKKTFCRYSVVVSKKTAGLATERNRLRRQFYEILRHKPPVNIGYDCMIFIKPAALQQSGSERQEKLLQLLNKIPSNNI